MKVLIIGGTRFFGRALSKELLSRGHELTLFHRGKTNPNFLPQVEHIFGDRETDIEKLGDREWDSVIDTCGYFPRIVEISVKYLSDKARQYVFISSISVYKETEEIGIDETADVIELEDPTIEDVQASAEAYGGLKALCEQKIQQVFDENCLIVRPGLIVGPHDPTHRFTYWPVRIRKGGKILAPGDGSFPLQFVDVRDLAEFTIDLMEQQVSDVFHVTGPEDPIPLKEFLEICINKLNPEARLRWVENDWLQEHEVAPWGEMPLWIPSTSGRALMQVSLDKALNHGLSFRSLDTTVEDTLDWYEGINGDDREWNAGLDPGKERELLKKLG